MFLFKSSIREHRKIAKDLWHSLLDAYEKLNGIKPNDSEIRSWALSLPILAESLRFLPSRLDDCPIYFEYYMPGSSSRTDVVIIGSDETEKRAALVIELKQWRLD